MCVIMSNLKHLLFVILGGIVLSSADAVGSDTCYKCVNCKDTPIDKIHTVRCSGSCFKMHGENDDGHESQTLIDSQIKCKSRLFDPVRRHGVRSRKRHLPGWKSREVLWRNLYL
ncbi:uncharacterized protein LOC128242137 isoform X2 [Mya arenaria]|uniref:uncharacterized protein LOC128242137 isoform X2 n=1 Tax=Mya arenaria TaxID=6604 RepID=UPI0022DF6F63|nr:uncharacterized protein LOC128242137 isoform X2 [Mya arenaria]